MPSKSACCGWTWTPTRTGTKLLLVVVCTTAGTLAGRRWLWPGSHGLRVAPPTVKVMNLPFRQPRMVVVEEPDALGYRLVADVLLDVMAAEEWLALERR